MLAMIGIRLALIVLVAVCGCETAKKGGIQMAKGDVLLFADFSACEEGSAPPEDWWVEGGEKVWIEDGHIRVKANPAEKGQPGHVATVWHRQVFPGDIQVDFDSHVIDSTIDANNINFFMLYTDPEGKPLLETRASRESSAYNLYHVLNGYIFTYLNDFHGEADPYDDGSAKGRMRMRRCPGFELMTETYAYHCRKGVTYHVTITKRGGDITFAVDGKVYLQEHDDNPWAEGLIGLRTFQTDLWWDNIKVTEL